MEVDREEEPSGSWTLREAVEIRDNRIQINVSAGWTLL